MDKTATLEAIKFFEGIDDRVWELFMGTQSREEFARLALDQGTDIELAWAEAEAHAESL